MYMASLLHQSTAVTAPYLGEIYGRDRRSTFEDPPCLAGWATNLMLINVLTCKLRRAVRLSDGDLPVISGDGTSKSAASRRFVALSCERLAEWMTSDLSEL
jgi:hypothetical protein